MSSLTLTAAMNIDRYLPNFPRQYIDPILSEAQKKIWGTMPANQVFFMDNSRGTGGIPKTSRWRMRNSSRSAT